MRSSNMHKRCRDLTRIPQREYRASSKLVHQCQYCTVHQLPSFVFRISPNIVFGNLTRERLADQARNLFDERGTLRRSTS